MIKKKTYSGKFVVRVEKDTHKALATEAFQTGESLNGLVKSILETATKKDKKNTKKSLVA